MRNCVIITAAGMSTRQKNNKLLLRSCNETMIEKTVYNFTKSGFDIFVIVGHQKELMIPILKHRFGNDITIVNNIKYKSGIASSLKAGIAAAGNNYEYYGFCNGDKPFLKSKTIALMLNYLLDDTAKILVPLYQENSGHPTFFSAKYISYFRQLLGDVGGKVIIDKFPNAVTYLPVNDEGVTLDLDKYLANE